MSIKFKSFFTMKLKELFGLILIVMISTINFSLAALAGTAYSPYWNIDSANNWHYTLANGQVVTDAWIQDEVSGDWYLIDSVGNMKSGLVTSNGKYYLLDNTRGTGHFGKLLKNGDIYNGITIYADTSASYQGALNDITLNQLANMGLSVYTAQNVTGTKQVSNGAIVNGGSSGSLTQSSNDTGSTSNSLGNTNTSNSGLSSYRGRDLNQSEISTLAAQGIPVITQDFVAQFPPYSQGGKALITYVDINGRLVLPGDDVDVMGNYDLAAYGHVGLSNIQEAMSYGSMHK